MQKEREGEEREMPKKRGGEREGDSRTGTRWPTKTQLSTLLFGDVIFRFTIPIIMILERSER